MVIKVQKDAKASKVHQGHLEKEVIQVELDDQVPRGWMEQMVYLEFPALKAIRVLSELKVHVDNKEQPVKLDIMGPKVIKALQD